MSGGSGAVAKPVHQQVEQAAGLIALARLASGQGHAGQARQHIAGLAERVDALIAAGDAASMRTGAPR